MSRLIATLLLLSCVPLAIAQEAKRIVPPMEIYPPHIRAAMDAQRRATLPGTVGSSVEMQGVFNRSKLWDAGQTLRVCFFDGLQDTRARIARAAKRWEKFGNIRMDFGDVNNPRFCRSGEVNEIRIGFDYKGYWSMVGQDSINLSRQTDQSMNLDGYNVEPPAEPEFTRIVLHEFGHALGLQHEHQNPKSTCESEFNWPEIYKWLAGPPNNWDKAKVDHNMRRLLNDGDVETIGKFNPESIMLYTFPAWMYLKGEQSSCFFKKNDEISKIDGDTLAGMYPANPAVALERRTKEMKALQESLSSAALDSDVRERALKNVQVLSTGKPDAARQTTLESLNAPLLR
jgi:hypothetical protein